MHAACVLIRTNLRDHEHLQLQAGQKEFSSHQGEPSHRGGDESHTDQSNRQVDSDSKVRPQPVHVLDDFLQATPTSEDARAETPDQKRASKVDQCAIGLWTAEQQILSEV